MTTTVIDLHKINGIRPKCDFYIGRATLYTEFTKDSKYCNPFSMKKFGENALVMFDFYITGLINNISIIKFKSIVNALDIGINAVKILNKKYEKAVIKYGFTFDVKKELKDKILGCWCKRQKWYKYGLCHGDILIKKLVN